MSEIDINDPSLANEIVETTEGVTGERFLGRRRPDDGKYVARVSFGQDKLKVKQREGEKKDFFLSLHLALGILANGEPTGLVVFDRPNSVVFERDGVRSSRVHAIMDFLDAPIGPSESIQDFGRKVQDTIAQEPSIGIKTRWEAQSKAQSQEEIDKALELGFISKKKKTPAKVGDYYTFLRGQKSFPSREDGSHEPTVTNPITGEEVEASVVVADYFRATSRSSSAS